MLKSLLLSAAVLGSMAQLAMAEPRSLTLGNTSAKDPLCSDDGSYCGQMTAEATLEIRYGNQSRTISGLPVSPGETAEFSATLIELSPGHVLAGVILARDEGLDGGHAWRRDLLLYDVNINDGSVVGPVLDFPVHGLVRTEADCTNWPATAPRPCEAEFEFNSRIDVIRASNDGYPVLTYRTAAVASPGGASREFGWNPESMLSSDGTALDDKCTFKRSFSYNPLSGRYTVDEPLPDCDQYLKAELLPRRANTEIREIWMRRATVQEVNSYVSAQTQERLVRDMADPKIEIGWIYNEMQTGNDIIVLRVSDGGRCSNGDCDLHFFATRNCVEPALCSPHWVQSLKGNRAYTVSRPQAPLDLSCPASTVLVGVGRDNGQYCLKSDGIARVADLPGDLVQRFPKE